MENIIIRKTLISDAQNLIDYCNQVGGETDFLTFGENEFGVTLEQEENFIRSTQDSENSLSLIAISDGKIVGSLNLRGQHRKRLSHVGEFGISILKKFWGQGIAQSLIKDMFLWAKKHGKIKKINLQVLEDNDNAIKLYKKMGFIEEGRLSKHFYVNNKYSDSILMGKFLGDDK